jgi:hypothetical protein
VSVTEELAIGALASRLLRATINSMLPSTLARQAYVKTLPYEKQATMVAFLIRALVWFGRQGIECRRVFSENSSADAPSLGGRSVSSSG